METIIKLFGEGEKLSWYQMSMRGVVIFVATLIMLRIAGQRTFGKRSPVDNVIIIILGAVLGRGIVGASPFIPVLVSSFFIVILHRFLGWLSFKNDQIGQLVKGGKRVLFEKGKLLKDNMERSLISEKDIHEGIRLQTNADDLDSIHQVFVERNGEISVVKKMNTT